MPLEGEALLLAELEKISHRNTWMSVKHLW